jgi:hypothetical protein
MAETKTTTPKTKKSSLFPNEPLVKIKLPITRTEKDDVWVSVNGKSIQIKRGVEVEIPRCYVEVLELSEKMLIKAIENQEALSGKANADELN